jgi:hypothetical protein
MLCYSWVNYLTIHVDFKENLKNVLIVDVLIKYVMLFLSRRFPKLAGIFANSTYDSVFACYITNIYICLISNVFIEIFLCPTETGNI